MIKQITAAILLLAFIAGTFSKTLIVADYYLNTASFAKNCINKARPKMHCNGKCQMMLELKAAEKKEADNKQRIEDLKNEVISSRSFFAAFPLLSVIIISNNYPQVINQNATASMPRSHFHPPSFIV